MARGGIYLLRPAPSAPRTAATPTSPSTGRAPSFTEATNSGGQYFVRMLMTLMIHDSEAGPKAKAAAQTSMSIAAQAARREG